MNQLLELDSDALTRWLVARGHAKYRAAQIRQWIYGRRAGGWHDMTDLPKTLRAELMATMRIWSTRVVGDQQSGDGTRKLLLELADGGRIECVLLPREGDGHSICISTQVGCAMGCVFCATGLDGLRRNLTAGEIIEQVLRLRQCLPATRSIRRIVVMGMGEPLANLDALLVALDDVRRPDGLDISSRRITISTVGLPEAITRLDVTCPAFRWPSRCTPRTMRYAGELYRLVEK